MMRHDLLHRALRLCVLFRRQRSQITCHRHMLGDNVALTRQAYVEFDLQAMMDGEVYSDFVVLWLLTHESRVEAAVPEDCWLERWSVEARTQGARTGWRHRSSVNSSAAPFRSRANRGGAFVRISR